MSAGRTAFDACIVAAEDAASHFDGPRLHQAVLALTQSIEAMQAEASLDEKAIMHVRRRLESYQNLCLFLQQTLHRALTGAIDEAQPPRYVCEGVPRDRTAPPLFRRYC